VALARLVLTYLFHHTPYFAGSAFLSKGNNCPEEQDVLTGFMEFHEPPLYRMDKILSLSKMQKIRQD